MKTTSNVQRVTSNAKEGYRTMKRYDYLKPYSVEEALDLLAGVGDTAMLIAGGTDVLVKRKLGQIDPAALISLKSIPDMSYIKENGMLTIGAMTTHRQLETSPLIHSRYPILHDAVKNIGSVQIRNTATIGGNIVNAAPSADTAPPLLALEAVARIRGPQGTRDVPLTEFFVGPGRTTMQPNEILTELVLTRHTSPCGGAYYKLSRRAAMDLPLLGVAVQLYLEPDRQTIRQARLAYGVAGPTPMRAFAAEALLEGRKPTPEILDEMAQAVCQGTSCRNSLRASAWYREEMITVFTKRMIRLAMERAAT
ncbi:MAG: FAD binding domain-containing protein [Deltaproteobacteria bacterium]|nr:FAD binding domain-containing protein [Deltaproteobacteria bacterium]